MTLQRKMPARTISAAINPIMRQIATDTRLKPMQCSSDGGDHRQDAGETRWAAEIAPAFGAEIIEADQQQQTDEAIGKTIEIAGQHDDRARDRRRQALVGKRLDQDPAEREDDENAGEHQRAAPPGRRVDLALVGAIKKRETRLRHQSLKSSLMRRLGAGLGVDRFDDDRASERGAGRAIGQRLAGQRAGHDDGIGRHVADMRSCRSRDR